MAMDKDLLLNALFTKPIPPDDGFVEFVVGEKTRDAKSSILGLINKIAAGIASSQVRVVSGANGNGKTLLNNWIKQELSLKNKPLNDDPTGSQSSSPIKFDYFFTYVSAQSIDAKKIGYEIFRNLQIHYKLQPSYTFSLLQKEVFREFQKWYKAPWFTNIPSYILRRGAHLVDAQVGGALSELLEDIGSESLDHAFEAADKQLLKFLKNKHALRGFKDFCELRNLGDIFVTKQMVEGKIFPPDKYNAAILDVLTKGSMVDSPVEVIEALQDVARIVKAKALIVIIDDANNLIILNKLIRFVNKLNDFNAFGRPRVLLILSMLTNTYNTIKNSQNPDETLKQKLTFNPPIQLPAPTPEDIKDLVGNLIRFRNEACINTRPIGDVETKEILEQCCCGSYRAAIQCVGEKIHLGDMI